MERKTGIASLKFIRKVLEYQKVDAICGISLLLAPIVFIRVR